MSPILIMDVLTRIESKTLELYGKYGIKSITMDDIARTCGISKKTLYENYANKKELVEGVITKLTNNLKSKYLFCVAPANDAVAEVLYSLKALEQFYRKVNYIMLEDLEKYYYDTWKNFLHFREEVGLNLLVDNIERGIKEGVYHNKLDTMIIARMRLTQLNDIHEKAHYDDNLRETLRQVSLHYIIGLATEKGRSSLEKNIQEQN